MFWSAVQRWGTSLISVANFTVLARLLGPEAYGLVALAGIVIAFCSVFVDEGFATAIVQRKDLEPEHLDSAFWASVGVGLFLTLASVAAGPAVAAWFQQPGIIPIFPWLALTLLISSLANVQDAILRRSMNFRGLAMRSLVAAVAGMAVAQPLAFAGYGVWSLVAGQLVAAIVGALALWRVSGWRPRARFSTRHFQDLVGFGSRMVGTSVVYFFDRRASDFLIGYFLGPAALGLYNMAARLVSMIVDVLTGIGSKVVVSAYSRMQGDPRRLRAAMLEATELSALLALPCFAGLAAVAPEVIHVLLGDAWTTSVPVLQALCALGIVSSVCLSTNALLLALGRVDLSLRLELLQTAAAVVVVLLVVKHGILAVAIAYAGRLVVLVPIRIVVANRLIELDLRSYLRRYAASLAGVLVMLLAIALAGAGASGSLPVAARLAIKVVTGATVYGVATLWMAPSQWRRAIEFARLAVPSRGS